MDEEREDKPRDSLTRAHDGYLSSFFLYLRRVYTFFQPSSVVSASRSHVMASPSAQVSKPYSVPVKVCYVLVIKIKKKKK